MTSSDAETDSKPIIIIILLLFSKQFECVIECVRLRSDMSKIDKILTPHDMHSVLAYT